MTRRPTTALPRVVGLVLPATAPGLMVLAGLSLAGILRPHLALILGVVVVAGTTAVLAGLARALDALRDSVDAFVAELSPGSSPPPAPGARRAIEEIRFAVQRLARGWRARADDAAARLASAEAIIEKIPDPLILLDDRRQIVRANAAAAALVGTLSPPCDLAAVLRNPAVLTAADAILRGEAARSVKFTLTVPVERQLRARFARIDRPALDAAVAVVTLHDVTELKRAEQMRADFIANASHELRTPLATLTGFIETLRGPARDDAEARERFLAIMGGQAMRMTRLVEDLLSLSRIELNEHVLPQGRVALTPLLQHLAETLELRAGERDMRIVLAVPPDLPDVQGDRDELAQVFQNLLDNAIKYGRAGTEISVGVATGRRPATISGRGPGGFVSVAIRDRGEGIAREHLPRLTERFYRVDTARSREMGGTGLGLAIVKHIVNRHRGFLEIDSTAGEGSTFTVLLRQYAA
jgi:two-component system, OmpR family, phosphate regulon sensor histidine kinase PhoR